MSRLIKRQMTPINPSNSKIIALKNVFIEESVSEDANSNSLLEEERERILQNADIEARQMVQQAQLQVQEMMKQIEKEKADWESEKKILAEIAYAEGFENGKKDGQASGYEEYVDLISHAQQIVESSKTAFVEHVEQAEKSILEIAIAASEKIMRTSLMEDKQKFIPIVTSALKEVREYKEIQIHVHPAQYESLLAEKKELEAVFPHNTQCFIYPNAELEEFTCLIESDKGRIDASLSTQLIELKEALLHLLEGNEA
nr:flagellar assembly protein FliH [Paenibacillus bovis]